MNTENLRGILVGIIAWQDIIFATYFQGRIQDFKLGGAHLNFFGGISCEKYMPPPLRMFWMKHVPVDFTPKNQVF
jgi:hypothetical protein